MAQNPHSLLPPSKRFKLLNPDPIQPLPAKKRLENLTTFPTATTGSSLPTKKRTQVLNRSPTSAFLPVKKRTQNLNTFSTTVCLPAKKRVWVPVPVPVSPDRPESQPRDLVPVKKRAWARFLSSPTKTETGVLDTNPKSADIVTEIRGGDEPNQLPAKKRVWIDLNTVQENDQIEDGEEVSDILGSNPVLAIQEVADQNQINDSKEVSDMTAPLTPLPSNKEVKEINGGKKRVLAPNPLSVTRSVTEKEPVNPKPLQENHQFKPKEVKKQVSAQNPLPGKKKVRKDLELDNKENRGVVTKKRVWAPNPLSVSKLQNQTKSNVKCCTEKDDFKVGKLVQDMPTRKKLRAPLSPIAEENDQTVIERVIEIDPEPVKLRAENGFEIGGGDDISGFPIEPLSPLKTETQYEDKGSESVEHDDDHDDDDDGVVCAVCQSTDGEPSDPIVFCDGCDLMVHASCYGDPLIESIPLGDWFCSVCSSSKIPETEKSCNNKRCRLCPLVGGALKPTVDGDWAHIMCALLVPEVFFLNPEGRTGIDCSRVPSKRWRKECFICGGANGCAIDCAESKCELGFHVSCGLEKGLCIEYREGKEMDIVAGFCTEHTKLWKKQQLTGKFRIVSSDQDTKKKIG